MFFLNEEDDQLENLLLKLPIDSIIETVKQYLQCLNTVSLETRVLRSKASQNHRYILLQELLVERLAHLAEEVLGIPPGFGIVVPQGQQDVWQVMLDVLQQLGGGIVLAFASKPE